MKLIQKKIFLSLMMMFFAALVTQGTQRCIKKVYVEPVTNDTNKCGLEASFTNAIVCEIMADGRLSFVNTKEEADGIIVVAINQYMLQPLAYGDDNVSDQYKLRIRANASLVEKEHGMVLWKENVKGIQIYVDTDRYNQDCDAIGDEMTEQEAQEVVWTTMSRDIVRKVVENSNTLEKKTIA
ncbi:MAG: LPS assembly lipoprotein LptE [Endomicrobium sp.]|jgi:hypothetical protein|nr:LPS assembly lipoprotein LptE [Endomicrobium sp.]